MTLTFSHYGLRETALVVREVGRFYRVRLPNGRECWIGESRIIAKG